MRRVLGALSAALLALAAPGAHAAGDSTYAGGCSYVELGDDPRDPRRRIGEIDVQAVVYSPTPAANPVSATVTCYLRIDGVAPADAEVTASGSVVVAGGALVSYERAFTEFVDLCYRVDFTGAGDTTPTVDGCYEPVSGPFPPPIVWETVDTVLCAPLAAARGTHGPVVVTEQGDVYLDGQPFYDCPPYDIEWGS